MPRYLHPIVGIIVPGIRAVLTIACLAAGLTRAVGVSNHVGSVYLVIGSDTAIWNYGTTVDVYTRHPHYSQEFFTDPTSPAFQVMDPAWRSQYRDSFGLPIKFTWWLMGGNIYRDADNVNIPVANTMVPHLMQKYHGAAIQQFGDELSLHYHTFYWSDYTGEGVYYWNQSQTFEECREDFDYTLAQYLLEEEIFPVSFRSGWHFMDNDWQAYLNDLIPYSMHDNWPAYRPWYLLEPINNVQDWSKAPSAFVPFHPDTNDYQLPGNGKGWDVRSIKMQAMAQTDMNAIFSSASNGVDQVACIWDHLPEAFVPNFDRIDAMAHLSASNHPGVLFRYCTAIQAMQLWRGLTNQSPPKIDVAQTTNGSQITLTIHSSVPLYQPRPFVAMRDAFQQYSNLTSMCVATGPQTWTLTLPRPRNELAKIAIAATDNAGNLTKTFLRYLPDDLYLDNLDAEYSEPQGAWETATNAAWGIDARVCLLFSNSTAKAEWQLPIGRSGFYALAIQVPPIENPASNLEFEILAGTSNVFTKTTTTSLPALQWIPVGTVYLDVLQTNRLQMKATNARQAGTRAVADVLRVVPLADPPFNSLAALLTPNGLTLLYSGTPGAHCQLQSSTDLSHWTTIAPLGPSSSGTAVYSETKPPAGTAFYRVQQ